MKTMNVMRYNDSSVSPALIPGQADVPDPKKGEVLIRVHAAGVTPTELQWYPTTHTAKGEARTGAIPGHEFSGVISAVGPDVDAAQIGREVFGMNDWFADGATSEYCIEVESSIAPKPASLSQVEAATVPIAALTAWQGLLLRAKIRPHERVLIHGGSGAVGVFAIQLARRAGAHVITTASKRNFEFLKALGADEVIDYHTDKFEEHGRDLDVVFDLVGGDTLARSWNLLNKGGRAVTIATQSEGTTDERIKKAFFIVEPDRQQLTEIAQLIDAQEFKTFVDVSVPLETASDAYCGKLPGKKGRGKTVMWLIDEAA